MTKKITLIALALLCAGAFTSQTYAATHSEEQSKGLSIEVGADMVTSYLWRGFNYGGLSIQPSITFDWNGLYLCGWANVGADNWRFNDLSHELDVTIGYDNFGFKLDLTHLYYFGGDKYFKGLIDPNNELSESTVELHAGIDVGEWNERVPLTFDWYTTVLGYDPVLENGIAVENENGNAKRAYSTYIELGYAFLLPLDIQIGIKAGFTPWKGYYTDYQEVWTSGSTIGINNIQLRAEREFEINNFCLNVWGEAMLNCYGINKQNFITPFGDAEGQKLNGCIGFSFYFGNGW